MSHVHDPTAGTSIRPGKVTAAHHEVSRGDRFRHGHRHTCDIAILRLPRVKRGGSLNDITIQ